MARKADRFEDSRGMDSIEGVVNNRFDNYDLTEDQIMKNLNMDYQNDLYIDLTYKPDDMVYCWARETVAGQTDTAALISRRRLGWTPVPRSRHPEVRHLFVDGSERDDDFIRIKGSILLERHIKYHEIATKRSQEDNFEAMKGVTAMEKLNSNNPVPLVNRENSMSFSHNKAGRTFN